MNFIAANTKCKGNRRGAEIAEADAEGRIFATDKNPMHKNKAIKNAFHPCPYPPFRL